MSIGDDKKTPTPARAMGKEEPNMVGAPIPTDRYRGMAERVADAEDHDAKQVKTSEHEEHGSPLEESDEPERRVSDAPPERNISPRE